MYSRTNQHHSFCFAVVVRYIVTAHGRVNLHDHAAVDCDSEARIRGLAVYFTWSYLRSQTQNRGTFCGISTETKPWNFLWKFHRKFHTILCIFSQKIPCDVDEARRCSYFWMISRSFPIRGNTQNSVCGVPRPYFLYFPWYNLGLISYILCYYG